MIVKVLIYKDLSCFFDENYDLSFFLFKEKTVGAMRLWKTLWITLLMPVDNFVV